MRFALTREADFNDPEQVLAEVSAEIGQEMAGLFIRPVVDPDRCLRGKIWMISGRDPWKYIVFRDRALLRKNATAFIKQRLPLSPIGVVNQLREDGAFRSKHFRQAFFFAVGEDPLQHLLSATSSNLRVQNDWYAKPLEHLAQIQRYTSMGHITSSTLARVVLRDYLHPQRNKREFAKVAKLIVERLGPERVLMPRESLERMKTARDTPSGFVYFGVEAIEGTAWTVEDATAPTARERAASSAFSRSMLTELTLQLKRANVALLGSGTGTGGTGQEDRS